MRTLILVGALATLALPTAATAQCVDGRVSSEQSAGRCCWPGQSWDATAARCAGPPSCPAGWVAEGDSCLQQAGLSAPGAPPSAAPPSAAPPAGQAGAPPQQPSAPLAQPPPGYGPAGYQQPRAYAPQQAWGPPPEPPMHEEEQSIRGLIITGTIMLGAGYVYSVIMASAFLNSSSCSGTQNSWSMYIPVIGGYIWGAVDSDGCSFSSGTGEALGIPGAGIQTVGLGLLLIGIFVKRTVMVPGPAPAASLIPRLEPGPGEAGLTLAWDF